MAFPAREALLADQGVGGSAFCRALSAATDGWLARLFADASDGADGRLALVAVGGYGRGELSPWSDLDLLLLHDGRRPPSQVAERLWYPIWDTKLKLGHAVRTVKEALRLAADDFETATSMLDCRHLAGDEALTDELRAKALRQWRKKGRSWLAQLAAAVDERHEAAGEVAFLLEPNLKDGRGGLRDVHALRWAGYAEPVLAAGDESALGGSYDTLLSVRVELHRVTGRPGDVLALQEQDAVAGRLGFADADELVGAVAAAARTVAWTSDETWHRVRLSLSGRDRSPEHPVAPGIVERGGEIHVGAGARPSADPTLLLRVATAAARRRTRIARATLDLLGAETDAWPDPWPAGGSDDLVALLLEGHRAIPVLESLDQRDLLTRVLPEWAPLRSRPQRNAYHRFTVDRHLWESAANAAVLAERVHRPDLLVLGALLHDVGKGEPGDHTENGIVMAERIVHRMGLPPDDGEVVVALVRHHLLLSDVATRRDITDDGTICAVAEALGSPLVLELLAAHTEADSLATGPSVWGSWKAELVGELVDRVGHVLGGGSLDDVSWSLFPSAAVLELMGEGATTISADGDRLTTVAPDRPGLFSKVAGVLALHGLDVVGAQAHSDAQGMAANEFRVVAPAGGDLGWDRVTYDLRRALDGQLAIEARLAERARSYRRRRLVTGPIAPRVVFDDELSSDSTVVEVHGDDTVGVLYRITKAMADLGLDIRHAKVRTLGHEVLDTFYVSGADGKVTDAFHRRELERALLHAVGAEVAG